MKVWLVISSYRNDADVIRLLHQAQEEQARALFESVLIVDSQVTGAVPTFIKEQGWNHVHYQAYDYNLGSGANLRERLRLAAAAGADYAYALNHDADIAPPVIAALLKASGSIEDLGAAYPLGYLAGAGRYNVTGTRERPWPAKLVMRPPSGPLLEAYWSSSNGALYALEPARRGILPWEAMWMGWEDLEYGWRLRDAGFRQVIVCDAVFRDDYEYAASGLRVVNKPDWRTFYHMRNLILATRRSRRRFSFLAVAAYRFLQEMALILVARPQKWQRWRYLFLGVRAGLRWDGKSEPPLAIPG